MIQPFSFLFFLFLTHFIIFLSCEEQTFPIACPVCADSQYVNFVKSISHIHDFDERLMAWPETEIPCSSNFSLTKECYHSCLLVQLRKQNEIIGWMTGCSTPLKIAISGNLEEKKKLSYKFDNIDQTYAFEIVYFNDATAVEFPKDYNVRSGAKKLRDVDLNAKLALLAVVCIFGCIVCYIKIPKRVDRTTRMLYSRDAFPSSVAEKPFLPLPQRLFDRYRYY